MAEREHLWVAHCGWEECTDADVCARCGLSTDDLLERANEEGILVCPKAGDDE